MIYLIFLFLDNSIKIWSLENFTLKKTLNKHSHKISSLSLSSDNNYILSSSYDSLLYLWDLKKPEKPRAFKAHTRPVFSGAISNDNRLIISGGADKNVYLWNVIGEAKACSQVHTGFVNKVQFNPGFPGIFFSCSEVFIYHMHLSYRLILGLKNYWL